MFLAIHHFLQDLLFPPFNSILIILLGLIMIKWRRKSGVSIIWIGVIFLYFQSIPLTAYMVSQISHSPPLSHFEFESSQAIVVLGGGVNTNSPEYPGSIGEETSTTVRLTYAAYLAKQDPSKLIVTSGGAKGYISEAEVMRDMLHDIYGVKNQILVEGASMDTEENARFVARILLPMHIKNIVLVTQEFHMQRAMMLFRKYGLNPSAAATDRYYKICSINPVLLFIPNVFSMYQTALVLHELLGYVIDEKTIYKQ